MPYRTPIFKSQLDGRWHIRPWDAYQAPVLRSPGPRWNHWVAGFNIVASWFLPKGMQRLLDVRPGAREYWNKVRKQEKRK